MTKMKTIKSSVGVKTMRLKMKKKMGAANGRWPMAG
ncbi:hypothetical protein COLO4_36084 [Corchorus olitorius]|uniref:Uncharacterized protein n=1 Tax=Corchorus olitorius TaxID=93759 RepID=A0A1R3GB06_9ROSI|nr:hypothetical protein COLO4_36084 [Corchorus olitorius]